MITIAELRARHNKMTQQELSWQHRRRSWFSEALGKRYQHHISRKSKETFNFF